MKKNGFLYAIVGVLVFGIVIAITVGVTMRVAPAPVFAQAPAPMTTEELRKEIQKAVEESLDGVCQHLSSFSVSVTDGGRQVVSVSGVCRTPPTVPTPKQ